ncbi:CU044_5270 family protein [Actinomadura rifamycini]|uniref:CU044_5270 family protein n=1 Tax=Actinomadura rifamycini TaxID=31962 RepID=UPI0003FAFE93|nr:CU044_5270 family protein [Actinomadura rifamycini]
MDEIDALRGMRTALAEEESPEALAARIDWRTDRRAAPPKPERRRPRFALPLVGVVAAGAAAAAAVALVPDGGGGGEVRAEPGNVLLVAADNAQKAPTGKYWHAEWVLGDVYTVGKTAENHYKVDSRQRLISWVGPDGKERAGRQEETDRPLTDEDMRKWRAAGSPEWLDVPDPVGPGQIGLWMAEPESRQLFPWDLYEGAFGLSVQEIESMPTEAGALKNTLLGLKGNWHAYTSGDTGKEPIRALEGAERVRALSEVAGTLLSSAPAPPKVRAAAFRMLADLPGVEVGGEAADRMGRKGTVVSLPLETTMPLGLYTAPKQLGTYERQFIVDPAKGALLEIRDVVATPPKGSRTLPPGDDGKPRSLRAENMPDRFHKPGELAGYQLFTVAEWTDERPE